MMKKRHLKAEKKLQKRTISFSLFPIPRQVRGFFLVFSLFFLFYVCGHIHMEQQLVCDFSSPPPCITLSCCRSFYSMFRNWESERNPHFFLSSHFVHVCLCGGNVASISHWKFFDYFLFFAVLQIRPFVRFELTKL